MNNTHFLVAGITLLAIFPAVAGGIAPAAPIEGSPVALDCRAALGSTQVRWEIELHDSLPLAVVDGDDTPADYAASHARVRLAAGGPSLVIGRVSGRLVISDSAGLTLGSGQCSRMLNASMPRDKFS